MFFCRTGCKGWLEVVYYIKFDGRGAAMMKEMISKILEVGYGRADITPGYPVGLAGSAASRLFM